MSPETIRGMGGAGNAVLFSQRFAGSLSPAGWVCMIRIRNLHKRFGRTVILDGLNLDVAPGETHVVIGRSGEGKSVLLKHVCALLAPDRGSIEVEKRPIIAGDRESVQFVRSKVAMVFQNSALFDSMTVRENVGFALDERGELPAAEIDAIVEKLLEEVNLPGTGRLFPSELSGGMRKRIGLARSLAPKPEIILYDEPTTGLDPITTDIINDLIVQTKDHFGVTSIVVTHDMRSAYKIGDRISMLYEGQILFTGTPDEVRHTDNPFVRQFVEGLATGPITDKDQAAVTERAEAASARAASTSSGRPHA